MRSGLEAGTSIKVTIGRFGSEPQEVIIEKDSTIRTALQEVGIEITDSDKVWVNGTRASLRDILDEGDIVNVVTPKQAGLK